MDVYTAFNKAGRMWLEDPNDSLRIYGIHMATNPLLRLRYVLSNVKDKDQAHNRENGVQSQVY